MIEELRPVFAQLAPSAMRMELTRVVSSRLAVPESLFEERLQAPARPPRARPQAAGGQAARAPANGARARGAPLAPRRHRARVPRAVHRLAERARRRSRRSMSSSTSPASCCAAPRVTCARATSATRSQRAPARTRA